MSTGPEPRGSGLADLGVGNGSAAERIKLQSMQLKGTIAEELAQGGSRFSDSQATLMKFHGVYQQEDRDARQARKAAGVEKAYSFMVRSRIPGGALSAEQYLVEDDLAGRFANGTLRITTRQGLQLHGVFKGELKPAIAAINAALLSTLAACGDVNRNVMACAAPAADRLQAQVQDTAHRIAMHLAPRSSAYHEIWVDGEQVQTVEAPADGEIEPIYGATYLPRKFKIGVAFPGDNCIDVYTQDIGLVAEVQHGELAGFTVLLGGGMGMTHGKTETYPRLATPFCFVAEREVLELVEGIVTIQRDYGDRQNRKHARMKYLVEEKGIAWFKAELERRLGRLVEAPHAIEWHDASDHLGWHQQGDGRWCLGLFVENGRVQDTDDVQFRTGLRLAITVLRPGIRLTGQQNILLTDIDEGDRARLEQLLAAHGIETDPEQLGGARRNSMACPALPTCGLALSEAERVLPAVVRDVEAELAKLGLAGEPLSMRMTGCPNGCARPYMGDIGFVGRTKDVYNVYVGGDRANTRMNTLFAASVHLRSLVPTLQPLLAAWRDRRQTGESLGDFCHRIGVDRLRDEVGAQYGT